MDSQDRQKWGVDLVKYRDCIQLGNLQQSEFALVKRPPGNTQDTTNFGNSKLQTQCHKVTVATF